MIEHAAFAPDSPPDIATRQAALDPTRSFAVSAPAGSGKTGLLTQRVLRLLTTCEDPEEILAITFTRKAAGEMQERILQALWASLEAEPDSPHGKLTWQLAKAVMQRDAEKNWNLLSNPQRLRVQTIDSLCRSITRQLPLASGIGAQPETLDNADKAYRLAVRELLALLENPDLGLQDDLTRLLMHLDNHLPAIENLLVALLARREQWLDILLQARHEEARDYLQQVLQDVVLEHLTLVHSKLRLHSPALCAVADRAGFNLQQEPSGKAIFPWGIEHLVGISTLPPLSADHALQWRQLAELLLTTAGTFRQRLTKNEGFPAGANGKALKDDFQQLVAQLREEDEDIEALLHGIRQLPPASYRDDEWQLLDSLTRLLPVLAAQLKLVFRQLGATDFTEITRAALTALGDEDAPGEIALQLDYRIRHILVDEFQDTASPQLQLLERLTAGWQNGDGRTLFIVGDGMQSCYGFRNANVGLFLGARQQGIGSVALEAIDLTVNFRSQTGVVRWVNDTFTKAFPATNDITRGAVSYSPSIAAKAEKDNPAVSVYACPYEADKDDEDENSSLVRFRAQEQEAHTVARLAAQALTETTGSVAILVRTRSHLQRILPALSAAGLTWMATEIDRLSSRMAIVDLISLTRALLDPSDRIAWLAILRAPWCGLDLYDLHRLVNADVSPRLRDQDFPLIYQQLLNYHRITGLSAAGQIALERLHNVLQPAIANRQRKPLRQWVEGVWLALGGPACLTDPDDMNNIPGYFSLLDRYQQAGSIRDWDAFTSAIDNLYAEPRSDANPRLQVMTIHKSKGLEFDTVIIPGLDRRTRNDDKQLLLWQERISPDGESQLLLGPLAATGEQTGPLYAFMRQEKDLQQRYEATRLLYVGCTRAINRLYLLACVAQKNEEWSAPGKTALLAAIWPMVKEELEIPEATRHSRSSTPDSSLTHILRLPAQWQRPALQDVTLLDAYRGHEFAEDEEDNNTPEADSMINRLARHSGTVLHRALQRITEQQQLSLLATDDMRAYVEQQRRWWQLQLQSQGWQHTWLEQALNKIERAFRETLQDEKGRWLLDPQHSESACEMPLQYWQANQLRESIVDRTFVDGEIRWIIDYKTSEPVAGQSVEEFVTQETEAYRPQLARYRRCFADMENREIRTALYFPLLKQKFIEVEEPSSLV